MELAEKGGFWMHPKAEAVLCEFGGTAVEVSGPGRDFARTPFDLRPEVAVFESRVLPPTLLVSPRTT